MADPLTVGACVAAALAMGAEALVKSAVGEAVKDAYQALKARVAAWAAPEAEALEASPTAGRKLVLAEAIDALTASEQAELQGLAEHLVQSLREAGPVGVDVATLEALNVRFGAISVSDGVGVRLGNVRAQGDVTFGDVAVGDAPAKKN